MSLQSLSSYYMPIAISVGGVRLQKRIVVLCQHISHGTEMHKCHLLRYLPCIFTSCPPFLQIPKCFGLFFFFFFFATPAAYGSSQARAQIGASAPGLHHSSWQHWILNSLSKARDWLRILMDTSGVCYHWATTATPWTSFGYVCNFILYVYKTTQISLQFIAKFFEN